MSSKFQYSFFLVTISLVFLVLEWYGFAISVLLLLGMGLIFKSFRAFQIQAYHQALKLLSRIKTFLLLFLIYFIILVPTSIVYKIRNKFLRRKVYRLSSLNYYSPQKKQLEDFKELW